MTKALYSPQPRQTAPVAAEQAPTHTSTHRESDDNYHHHWVVAPLAALPAKPRKWLQEIGAIQ